MGGHQLLLRVRAVVHSGQRRLGNHIFQRGNRLRHVGGTAKGEVLHTQGWLLAKF